MLSSLELFQHGQNNISQCMIHAPSVPAVDTYFNFTFTFTFNPYKKLVQPSVVTVTIPRTYFAYFCFGLYVTVSKPLTKVVDPVWLAFHAILVFYVFGPKAKHLGQLIWSKPRFIRSYICFHTVIITVNSLSANPLERKYNSILLILEPILNTFVRIFQIILITGHAKFI